MGVATWASRYVGIPYVWRGRSFDGADCWGLVRLIYEREFGVILPMYSDAGGTQEHPPSEAFEDGLASDGWVEVDDPDVGTGVLLRVRSAEIHCGICVGDDMFLHTMPQIKCSALERLQSWLWRPKIAGYFLPGNLSTKALSRSLLTHGRSATSS